MNRDELLAQLRDIHLPPEAGELASYGLALWPPVLFLAIALALFAVIVWRRTTWQRELGAELSRIERMPDRQARWQALIALATRVARLRHPVTPLPAVAYRDPRRIDDAAVAALTAHVRAMAARAAPQA